MRGMGHAIVVESHAQAERQTARRSPLIGHEPGSLVLINAEGGWRCKSDTFNGSTRSTDDLDGQKRFSAIVGGVGIVRAGLPLMCAQEMPRRELIDLLPLEAIGPASLTVEETSLRRLNQKLIGVIIRRGNVGIVSFVADL